MRIQRVRVNADTCWWCVIWVIPFLWINIWMSESSRFGRERKTKIEINKNDISAVFCECKCGEIHARTAAHMRDANTWRHSATKNRMVIMYFFSLLLLYLRVGVFGVLLCIFVCAEIVSERASRAHTVLYLIVKETQRGTQGIAATTNHKSWNVQQFLCFSRAYSRTLTLDSLLNPALDATQFIYTVSDYVINLGRVTTV